jgi:hypothetical protein
VTLAVVVLFVVVPCLLGYATGTPWIAVLPGMSLSAALATWAGTPRPYTDEVDVLPFIWVVASAVAVVMCLAGALARHASDRKREGLR